MVKGKGASGFLQRLQQSNAAKTRNVATKVAADTYSFDLRNATEPDRVYYAKEAWIEYDRGQVSFCFGQKRRDDDQKLRSLICVNLAPDHAMRLLKAVEEMQSPSLAEIAQSLTLESERVSRLTDEAEQTVELSATMARVAVSGYDSSMDFHKLPPIALADAKTTGSALKTIPQVRVDLRTSLLMGLLDNLRELKNQLPQHAAKLPDAEE
jgi:hypothetical protein